MDQHLWPRGVRKHGTGIQIRLTLASGKRFSHQLPGPVTKARIAEAKRLRDTLISRDRLGLPLFPDPEHNPQRGDFFDAAQRYINSLDSKFSTYSSYVQILNQHWLPQYGHRPLSSVTEPSIKEYLTGLQLRSKTKKNLLIVLRGVLDHAGIRPNPAAHVHPRREQRAPIHRYTPEDRGRLLAQLEGQALCYFALLFGCGLRPGEALALEWTDYNGSELSVSKQITRRRIERSTKTSVIRRVFVPSWVRPILNDQPNRFKHGFIFTTGRDTHHRDTDVFNGAWRRAHQRARIPYRIPYTCRHSRAAELLSTGVPPAAAAKQLGHSVEMFLRIYSEWIEEYSQGYDKTQFEGVQLAVSAHRR